jgi:hypothetical protein
MLVPQTRLLGSELRQRKWLISRENNRLTFQPDEAEGFVDRD